MVPVDPGVDVFAVAAGGVEGDHLGGGLCVQNPEILHVYHRLGLGLNSFSVGQPIISWHVTYP